MMNAAYRRRCVSIMIRWTLILNATANRSILRKGKEYCLLLTMLLQVVSTARLPVSITIGSTTVLCAICRLGRCFAA